MYKLILIIDDDKVSNLISGKVLQSQIPSEKMEFRFNGREAIDYLEFLKQHKIPFPELILLDINMPELDGWGFLELFNQFDKSLIANTKVYMLSSSIDRSDFLKANQYNLVSDFIVKPLSFNSALELKRALNV